MHSKRYNHLTESLFECAVAECLKGKWDRRDVLTFVEKNAGIRRVEMLMDEAEGTRKAKQEAIEGISLYLQEIVAEILTGQDPEDMDPVRVRHQPDGMTGKMRDIALLCIPHQLIGHLVKLMLDPLFKARILPTQHASIPGHGQTSLKGQVYRYLLKTSLGIKYVQKTDVAHAYASLKYSAVIRIVEEELPRANELIALLKYLEKLAPGGHLIIGGYIDAWLFNFAMSYAIGYIYTLGAKRRGKFIPYIKQCVTYMDDFALLSSSIKGLKRAIKELERWMKKSLGLRLKVTTGIIKILTVEEEKLRKTSAKKAGRGVPVLDMAGYKISRTHISIRPRVFIRMRRQLLRGREELLKTGTLGKKRAEKLIAYNGYIQQTNSRILKEKYHVKQIMSVAKKVKSFYGWLDHKRRKEYIEHVMQKCRSGERAEASVARKTAG